MNEIIKPIDKNILKKELTEELFIRKSNKANRNLYIITHETAPNVMLEIGRLRELTFRAAGGGTGKDVDIDKYDTAPTPFKQIVVWDHEDEEIVGGYRYLEGENITKGENETLFSPTCKLFHLSDTFIKDFLPKTIELGRSFVQPKYQSANISRKGLYSLDNLWDGLGALIVMHPEIEYFFGKFTMYPEYNRFCRDILHTFLFKFFPDDLQLVVPHQSYQFTNNQDELLKLFTGENYDENLKILASKMKDNGERIPPLVNAYMNLSPTMKTFGTAINSAFGAVEETGILIRIPDIYEQKTDRHVSTFKR